jgi:hypothetical protein
MLPIIRRFKLHFSAYRTPRFRIGATSTMRSGGRFGSSS